MNKSISSQTKNDIERLQNQGKHFKVPNIALLIILKRTIHTDFSYPGDLLTFNYFLKIKKNYKKNLLHTLFTRNVLVSSCGYVNVFFFPQSNKSKY